MSRALDEIKIAADECIKSLSRAAGDTLKTLLETKHIYQQIAIDTAPIIAEYVDRAMAEGAVNVDPHLFDNDIFAMAGTQLRLQERTGVSQPVLTLIVDNVKLFCSECDEREVFSPVWYVDLCNEVAKPNRSGLSVPGNFQLFSILLQCQRCKTKPEAVLIRREGWRLSLHGRSPMEHVELPKYVPKQERDFFRDALIASHGGKNLAALFYLRTFIEQFARRVTGETGRRYGEEIMEAYNETLPEPQRSTMPSLREWYGRLSEPIHSGKPDEVLFEDARKAIEHHLDIRRVFKIPEK